MGRLIDGRWITDDAALRADATGAHRRDETTFRDTIAPGARFAPEPGRYHLYVSLACPWAHRALIMRALKRLEPIVTASTVHWHMGEEGWGFRDGHADPLHGAAHLHEIYTRAAPRFTGRVTVPVLWDRAENTIVNNESADLLRIFNGAFDGIDAAPDDYHPPPLRDAIDAMNARVFAHVNAGVYACGFARTQAAYDAAIGPLFETLDWLEAHLAERPFLCGDRLTEADIRLFCTLIRFDTAYHGHFKCNRRRIVDYPALWDFTRSLYQHPPIRFTVDLDHINRGYHGSMPALNPSGIIPVGPALDLDTPGSRRIG